MTDEHTEHQDLSPESSSAASGAETSQNALNTANDSDAGQPEPVAGEHTADVSSGDSSPSAESNGDEAELIDALRQVVDPELMINIIDLGLVYEIARDGNAVNVEMTLTSPACPAGPQIMQQSKMALERLDSVNEARIKLVMSPPWSPERMTDEARDQLGIF